MPDNNLFGVDFIARCIAGEGLETANKRQWKLQAGPRILLSDNPETQTTTISATGDDITVDDALSTTSENPVQNKVITNELLTKPTCVLPNGTKVNNQNIMQLTRTQYDAIQNKDPNTYYMVTGDSEEAVFYRTAYVDMTNDYTRTIDSDGALLVTFEVPDDFSMLEARICYTVNWTCGSWTDTNSSLTSILTITPTNDAPPRDGRKIYMGVITDQYIGEAPNQTHVNVNTAQLLGANYITYDETNNTVTIKVTKPIYAYDELVGDEVDNINLTVNSYTVDELGYVAYGSDNINITTDSYTAGTGISIDSNHAISISAPYAANIEATMDPSTYVITLRLKDQNGIYLGTAQTIDLPLESVVVSGTYDDTTKKIILTLENGQTIEFSVADLVSGLETSAHAASTYLTQNDAANTYATQLSVSGLKTVPAVTSSDDGKILTADYTGGVGSYAWTSPQTFSQQQADWTEADSSAVDYIKNKPSLAAVATSGSYNDLSGKPSLATVATSGDYDDLTNKPTIPAAQVNADWNASSGVAQILNKPTLGTAAAADTTDFATAAQGTKADTAVQPSDLATVATSGSYNDLSNKPTIPAAQVNADWNSSSGVSEILNKPNLATVATSGSYNDLSNKPTIPAAQIPADWNQTDNQAVDYIKNKPSIPAAQVNSDWNAASGVSQILNKPDLSVYLTSSDLSGYATENYVDGKVPDTTQYDEGKYLTVGSNGNEWALIDEVPDIGSSDDGKVLTASYSGGVGSYSWQPASGGGGGGLSVETDGTNYWITVNGIRLYFASSAPSGTIPNGSLGIGW